MIKEHAMKFLENKTEKIVTGIFCGGVMYFIGSTLMYLATLSTTTSEIGHYISLGIFYLGVFCKPIGVLVIFIFLCAVLFKALKALDKYNNE